MSVSLSEILNVPADPERGTGMPATVIDTRGLVDTLNQNARFKAENDWRKYMNFQNNLKEQFKNQSALQEKDIAATDKPALQNDAAALYEMILKNPGAFQRPDSRAYGDIQAKYGELQGKFTRSKQDNTFDQENRAYIARNPELNTDENKAIIDDFISKPLGSRQPYNLSLPTIFDYDAYRNNLLSHPSVKTKFAESGTIGGFDPKTNQPLAGEQFIRELEGNKYNYDRFMQLWDAGLGTQKDKYGHSIGKYAKQVFDSLPKQDQQYYAANGGLNKLWHDMGERAFGSKQDITETTKDNLQPNNQYLRKQEISQGWARLGLEQKKLDKGNADDMVGADAVLREVASIVNKGVPMQIKHSKDAGQNKTVYEISDPTLLRGFGKIDKDGNVTNVPDVVHYDKGTDELNLVYYDKDDDGNVKLRNGEKLVQKSTGLNPRTWLKEKVKLAYPNKDIGGVNSFVEDVFTKAGGNLQSLSDLYFGKQKPAFDKSAMTAIQKNGKTFYIDPASRKVYDENGGELQ